MSNVAKSLPRDKDGAIMQEYPAPIVSLEQYTSENATASSVVTLTDNTTALEVAAIGGSAAIKWIARGDTTASVITVAGATSNYDHVVPTGTVRRFVVPKEVAGSSYASVQGINRGEGLYQRVAYKTFGVASVMATEY